MCNNSSYCLIFWSASIGTHLEQHSYQVDSYEKNKAIRQIKQFNESVFNDPSLVPRLYSGGTNWRGKPFRKLLDLLQELDGDLPDFEKKAREMVAAKEMFQFPEDYEVTEEDKAQIEHWVVRYTVNLRKQHPVNLIKQHRQIFQDNLACKWPILVNYELIDDPL